LIYLFYGDSFFTEIKLKTRKKEFATKYGKENIFQLSAKEFIITEAISTIWGSSLFASKKMIIISGLPQDTTTKFNESTKEALNKFYDYFVANKSSISEDNLIIFTTSTPDKKTRRAKLFLDANDPQIKLIEHKADKKSMLDYIATKSNGRLTGENAELLISICNENMYVIDSELKKITSYLDSQTSKDEKPKTLNFELITSLVSSTASVDVRSFLDGIILHQDSKSKAKLINFAHGDSNEFQFLGLLYWSIGGILNLIDCREHGLSNPGDLAKNSKLPPFTVSRYLSKKELLLGKKKQFQIIYHQLVDMDYKLKTGLLPPESFWPWIYNILQ
jgi:hypothetical protein